MRIFITSTPEELESHRLAAYDTAAELGHRPLGYDPARGRGLRPVDACSRQVHQADAVLAIVGHRRGRVPPPGLGGDGFHPWTWWETRAAFDRGLPVTVLMAADTWCPELREDDAGARSVMSDFRGELARLAVPFDDNPGSDFRELVRRQLEAMVEESAPGSAGRDPSHRGETGGRSLRGWPPPELPARPYPVLLPYTHPDLLAGRDRELAELRWLLARPIPILGLHAPSGTGKSSFLHAGLVQGLRAEGRPVAFDRHPCEPGIARRLLGDLLAGDGTEVVDDDPYAFVDRLHRVRRFAGRFAVLVLDQFEDLFRRDDATAARAVVGPLLAASAQRQPGLSDPLCRWLLAYRQEYHGEVFQWLADVLHDIRATSAVAGSLPHDLSGSERFHAWPLLPLGTPAPGTDDRTAAAARVFREAIEKPLRLTSKQGEPVYPWRFAGDGAVRLAEAFAEARVARRHAPLAPELQVVLAHLLERAAGAEGAVAGGIATVDVPEDPKELVDRALEEHLKRSLDVAFPAGKTASTKLRRTRALLALRELAGNRGRRDEGRPVAALARAIGIDGHDVLEKLATAQTRLVLLEHVDGEPVYVLSHDRMAEVIVRLVDDEGAYAGLGIDAELLRLRRFIALQRELFTAGEVEQSIVVPEEQFSGIQRHVDTLLWDNDGRRWWRACRERRRHDRRSRAIRVGIAAAVFVLTTLMAGVWADRYFERQVLLEAIEEGEPEAAFESLAVLTAGTGVGTGDLLARVRQREQPFDVLEHGLGGVEEARGPAVVRVAELLLPLLAEESYDPVRIASTVWALDFFAAPDVSVRERAFALRDQVLEPLRRDRPPPPLPAASDPRWADIPAGTFWMGAGPDDGRDEPNMRDEFPRHQVTLSGFRMMVHEVTNVEVRRLWPEHGLRQPGYPGGEDQPASSLSWYQAYTYAAWLGGRLPTESESEYSARAGCHFPYCRRDGSEATRDEVAWWVGNSADPETGEPMVKPVMRLEPNPWGLWDVYGNVWEWNATWYGTYSETPEKDPPGPTDSRKFNRVVGVTTMLNYRTYRGGSVYPPHEWVCASGRGATAPNVARLGLGLRVVLADPPDR